MKTTTTALATHLTQEVTRLVTCWRVRRKDGVVLGFTTHDRALEVEGLVYRPSSAFTPTAIADSNRFNVDNLDVTGVLSSAAITEPDLRSGLYDGAEVRIFLVDWADPDGGTVELRQGWIGEVTLKDGVFVAEVRGLMQALQHTFGAAYSPECRADLGDSQCKVNLSAFTLQGTVATVTDHRRFTASPLGKADDWFAYGLLRWLTGDNAGRAVEVKAQTGDAFELWDAMASDIAVGDLFTVHAGCDKRFSTCKTKFANAINFRGEPHMPGADAVLDYPGVR
ncbi:MAG: DUF2163 domain-containing protein [Alphaproteobacteria bacterium]|nr:MAG: DUF2163 domain-containing protein [Alphaproteobacteria bacterium]